MLNIRFSLWAMISPERMYPQPSGRKLRNLARDTVQGPCFPSRWGGRG